MTEAVTVFALAFATGFSLYISLAAPGLAAHLGLLTLPAPLAGLEQPAVWGSLLVLATLEWLSQRFRLGDLIWNGIHTIARPLAAALLASALLAPLSAGLRWTGSAAAILVALAVHLAVMGARIASRVLPAGSGRVPVPYLHAATLTGLAFAVAAATAYSALVAPGVTGLIVWFTLIASLPLLPGLWTLSYAALRAFAAALWLPGRGRSRWEAGLAHLPASVRRALESSLVGPPNAARLAPLTLARLGARRPLCRGRLVISPDTPPLFIHRRLLYPEILVLGHGTGNSDEELVLQTLSVDGAEPYALCVGPEAPPARAILAALTGEEGVGGWTRGVEGG